MSSQKVEIISRKAIKPSCPTPQCLKTFNISQWDKYSPPIYGVMLCFYLSGTNPAGVDIYSRFTRRSQLLQKALSDTLMVYYPLAGRLKDDFTTIECKDEGAHFVEAQINCKLPDFLSQPDAELLNSFIPTKTDPMLPLNCTLAIQLTLFNCGGLAVSACASHKIFDANSMCTFLQWWTAMARECYDNDITIAPMFLEPSLSPPEYLRNMPIGLPLAGNFKTKRFVFHASKLACRETKITGAGQQPPLLTNLDVVMALIMKCASAASRSTQKTAPEAFVLFHLVNMRKRVVPPLQMNTIGNIIWSIPTVFRGNHGNLGLNELAGKIRGSLIELYDHKAKEIKEKGEMIKKMEEDIVPYTSSSISAFPFYETDFGWGKPAWITTPSHCKNLITLVETKNGDGIEAWISLDEKEMAIFELDEELLAFATHNPSVLPYRCRM